MLVRKITAERMVELTRSDALWDFFRATGYIGAYILYRNTIEDGNNLIQKTDAGCEAKGVAGI